MLNRRGDDPSEPHRDQVMGCAARQMRSRVVAVLGPRRHDEFSTGGDVHEPDAHWVSPKLVAQVGFTEWTRDGKLRHPRYTGLRTDKEPDEVVGEMP